MKSSKQEKKYKQYLKLIKEYNEVVDLIRKEPLIKIRGTISRWLDIII